MEIERLLDEDTRFGDMTTRALGIGDAPARMTFTARRQLVLCGSDEAARLLSALGASVSAVERFGTHCDKGTPLLEATRPAAVLHAGWKAAQILVEWASGIATLTDEIVTAVRAVAPKVAVLCTRKSIPFTRQLSLKAVIAGGGGIHWLGLSDTVMLFPEHRALMGSMTELRDSISRLRERLPERAIMAEVTSEADAVKAAEAEADVIQLEKFSVDAVRRVAQQIEKRSDGRPIIAAAGGINVQNATEYALSGADTLITSAPFYAVPLDVQVCIEPL
ncbi:MAG: ModD protein [Parvibaculum sp.]|nr:ModD protein [Parvibaculum sp.]